MAPPGDGKSLMVSLAVSTQYTNVTDGRTDGHQRPRYAKRRAVKSIPLSLFLVHRPLFVTRPRSYPITGLAILIRLLTYVLIYFSPLQSACVT